MPSPSTTRRPPAKPAPTPDPPTPPDPETAETPGWASPPPPDPSTTPPAPDFPPAPTGEPSEGASRARTRASSLETISREGLTEAATEGFHGIGEAINAATRETDDDDVWLVRDREASGFGKAAGRMLARRVPDIVGEQAADASDLLSVIVTVGVWAIRGLAEWLPRGRDRWFPRARGRHRVIDAEIVDDDQAAR